MFKAEYFLLFSVGLFAFPPPAPASPINALWTGSSGSYWTTSANWNPSGIPNNNGSDSFSVSILSTTNNPVILGTNTIIDQLIMAGTTLNLSPGITLQTGALQNGLNSTVNIQNGATLALSLGTYTNNGVINLGSTGSQTTLELVGSSGGTVTLGGSGTLNMNGGGSGIVASGGGLTFENGSGHTIQGSGYIAPPGFAFALNNSGTISANQSSPLYVAPTSLTNGGRIIATNSASLNLTTGDIGNGGGTISANGGFANITTSGVLTGGTVEAVNGGVLEFQGSATGATLNAGAGSTLNLNGAPVTGGAINVTGTLNVVGGSNPYINSTLTNSGTVNVNAAAVVGGAMVNNSGAAINVSNGTWLSLVAGGTYTNNGVINLGSTGSQTALEMVGGGTVTLGGSGTLNMNGSGGSGIVASGGGLTLENGSGHTIQGSGYIAPPGYAFALTNDGTISANQSTALNVAPTSLTNGGLIIATNHATLNLTTGDIGNGGGTISANGGFANVTTSGVLTGGTVEAVNGGVLEFQGSATGATLNADAGSTLNLNGAPVTGGAINVTGTLNVVGGSNPYINSTLTNSGTVNVNAAAVVGGAMVNNSGAAINVSNGTWLSLVAGGTYTNNGVINLGSTGSQTALELVGGGTVTLGGSGTLNMNGSGGSGIVASGGGLTLENGSGHTIQGSGYIAPPGYAFALTNDGTITAAGSAGLIIGSSSVTNENDGTFGVDAGSKLTLTGFGFSNYYSSSDTLVGGTYDIAGFFQFQGADIVTNQADLLLRGSSWSITDGSASGTRDLAGNGTSGSISLLDSADLSTSQQFTNAGSVFIGSGSTFSATAPGDDAYFQTAGTTRVDGTLHGNVDIRGGSLSGSGAVDGNLYNAAAVDPGDSPGTLFIFGNYTQGPGGVLNIELLNAIVYDQLDVRGSAVLGGMIDVTLLPGYVLNSGDEFLIVRSSSVSGTFTWDLPVPTCSGCAWTTFIDSSGLELEYHTPEPAAWSMVAAGALWLWWRKRRARNAA